MLSLINKVLATNGQPLPGSGGQPLPGGGFSITRPPNLPTELLGPNGLLDRVTTFLLILAIPIATFMFLWSAWQFLTSAGDEEKIKTAKRTLWYTIIGLIIVIIAKGLPLVIANILTVGPGGGDVLPEFPPTGGRGPF